MHINLLIGDVMKTVGVRALRENPGVLSQSAADGEFVLFTNRNDPISLAVPFNDELLRSGVHVNLAVTLYEQGVITLVKAAALAKLSVEAFLALLAKANIVVVDQSLEELKSDLDTLSD